MRSRTQIVCMHEGQKGRSIDPVFINTLLKKLDPPWIRPWTGSRVIDLVPCHGRSTLIAAMPGQLRACIERGGSTTLMVWADLDHDMASGDRLKEEFWKVAEQAGITRREEFERVVFIFA